MAVITGTNGTESLVDTAEDDTIEALAGIDSITISLGGNDTADGGADSDRLILDARVRGGGVLMAAPTQNQDGLSGSASWTGTSVSFQRVEHFSIYSAPTSNSDSVTTGGGDDVFHHYGLNSPTYLIDTVDLGAGNIDLLVADMSAVTDYSVTNIANPALPGRYLITVQGFGKVDYTNVERLHITGGTRDDTFLGLVGDDIFYLQRGGADTATGETGNDGFFFGAALTSADSADGGAGRDYATIQGNYSTAPLTLGAGFVNMELLTLLPGSDTSFGDTANQSYSYSITTNEANVAAGQLLTVDAAQLRAGENFSFNGAAETDGGFKVYGGLGADNLVGGSQSDFFLFTEDRWGTSDTVDGGAGSARDQLALRGNYSIFFGAGQITSIESLVLLSGHDTRANTNYGYLLFMSDANLAAGAVMTVDAGQLRADEGLNFFGHTETDGRFRIFGGAGGDQILGGEGADDIRGGAGGDNLYSRGGADRLTGGADDDRFAYDDVAHSGPTARDTILDFTTGDIIALNTIDAVTATGVDDAFTFIGSAAFTLGTAGQLRVYEDSAAPGRWFVEADVNGDAVADMVIEVYTTDQMPLDAPDFAF